MNLRTVAAVLAARLAGWASRLSGRGGSSLPGLVARRIDPQVLVHLSRHLSWGSALLTGTNGKTTTSAMVRHMLEQNGTSVLSNRSGANLILGLTASFVAPGGGAIRPKAAVALLETDEASMPAAGRELRPRIVTVTNFFRDQLDRYGELSTTVRYVAQGIASLADAGTLVLNADDPQVAGLHSGNHRAVFFGIGGTQAPSAHGYDAVDARFCPHCGSALEYARRLYAHLGHYRCPACHWRRPDPSVVVERWDRSLKTMWVSIDGHEIPFPWVLPGLYNLYNQAAAIATAHAMGVPIGVMQESLATMRPAFGRMEHVQAGATELWLALVKNPVGFNQVLAAMADDENAKYSIMVLINDRYADGRDVSWLWDVDFEYWAPRLAPRHWYVGGVRSRDMAVRLKYAGIGRDQITVEGNIQELLDRAAVETGADTLYVLPTYTAMLEFRQLLTDRGLAPHFREG